MNENHCQHFSHHQFSSIMRCTSEISSLTKAQKMTLRNHYVWVWWMRWIIAETLSILFNPDLQFNFNPVELWLNMYKAYIATHLWPCLLFVFFPDSDFYQIGFFSAKLLYSFQDRSCLKWSQVDYNWINKIENYCKCPFNFSCRNKNLWIKPFTGKCT